MPVKPLYMAKSLEELNKKADSTRFKQATPKSLCKVSESLYLKAKDGLLAGDQEQSYIMFMRFLEACKSIRKSKEYHLKKAEFDKFLPAMKVENALKQAAELSDLLKQRYAELMEPNKAEVTNHVTSGDDHVMSKEEDQVVPQLSKPLVPSGVLEEDVLSAGLPCLTTQELFTKLTHSPSDVMVLDCRQRSEYNACHPDAKKTPQWLSIPEETVHKGVNGSSAEVFLSPAGKKVWRERSRRQWVVLVDDCSTVDHLQAHSDTPILALKDAIYKWDTGTPLMAEPCVLEGGFAKWHLAYAPLCVGTYKRKEATSSESVSDPATLQYPSFPVMESEMESDISTEATSTEATTTTSSEIPAEELLAHQEDAPPLTVSAVPATQTTPTYSAGVFTPFPILAPPTLLYAPPPPLPQPIPVDLVLEGEAGTSAADDISFPMLDHPQLVEIGGDGFIDLPLQTVQQQQPVQPVYQQPVQQQPVQPVYQQPVQQQQPVQPVYQQPVQQQPVQPVYQQPVQQQQPVQPVYQQPVQQQPVQPGYQQPVQQQPAQHVYQQPVQQQQPVQPVYQQPNIQQQQPVQPVQQQPVQQQPVAMHQESTQPVLHQQHDMPMQYPRQEMTSQDVISAQGGLYHTSQQPQLATHRSHPPAEQTAPSSNDGGIPFTQSPHSFQPRPHSYEPQQQVQTSYHPNEQVQTSYHPNEQVQTSYHPNEQASPQQPNPRLAYGSVPNPPNYDNALHMPLHAPVQPPIPPPAVMHPNTVTLQQPLAVTHPQPHTVTHPQPHAVTHPQPHTIPHPSSELQSELNDKDARIEDLQNKLADREKESHWQELERQRGMEEMKQALEMEKQKVHLEAQQQIQSYEQITVQERENIARQKQDLEAAKQQHQLAVDDAIKNLKQLRAEVDREKAMVQASQQHLALRALQQGKQTLALKEGVPQGWEKRLDSATGRFYYVDHVTKTTHWNPPTNWINYQEAEAQRLKGLQPAAIPPHPPSGEAGTIPPTTTNTPAPIPSGSATSSHVTPAPSTGDSVPPVPTTTTLQQPVVDRGSKPHSLPTVDRSSKPVFKPQELPVEVRRRKILALQPEGRATDVHMANAMTGLRNLGNTCFMNSILQCLCSTTPLVQYFTSGRFQEHINYHNPLGSKGAIAFEFSFLVEIMWSSRYRMLSPRDFKALMETVWRDMRGGQQHDAQEFLAVILDRLHEDLNRVKVTRVQSPPDTSGSDQELAAVAWQRHLEHNNSIIVKCFQGMLRSTIQCRKCEKRSVSFEPFMYLGLPLPLSNKATTLEECIQLFTKPEYVEWMCPVCEESIQAVKQLTLWKLPPILLFHIKRFQHDGMWKDKKQNHLFFPTRDKALDMKDYVVGEKPKLYSLYGVSNHYGTLEGGHYTAFCKNPSTGKFNLFDDQVIRDASNRDITGPAAYLLFYTSADLTPSRVSLR